MRTYLVKWPDSSISVIAASSLRELFWKMDEESSPLECEICQLRGSFHITTEIDALGGFHVAGAPERSEDLVFVDGAKFFPTETVPDIYS